MLRTSDGESEILLGNKQLLGIFFVLAILLGAAFYGGYVVGKGVATRTTAVSPPPPAPAASDNPQSLAVPPTGGETHSVPADSGTSSETSAANSSNTAEPNEAMPLGSPKHKAAARTEGGPNTNTADNSVIAGPFAPRTGQIFLQVTAVGRDEAIAIADVLRKKGFQAHAVPKPGSGKLYRVIVGPVHDAGDLSSTRESLRRTGFREVIVQHY